MASTQNRLATGKKVNSALDNPTNFFTSQSLSNRASDLNSLLDSIGQAQKTLEAADKGITSLTKLVESAKSIAKQARRRPSRPPQLCAPSRVTGNADRRSHRRLTAARLRRGGCRGDSVNITIDVARHRPSPPSTLPRPTARSDRLQSASIDRVNSSAARRTGAITASDTGGGLRITAAERRRRLHHQRRFDRRYADRAALTAALTTNSTSLLDNIGAGGSGIDADGGGQRRRRPADHLRHRRRAGLHRSPN